MPSKSKNKSVVATCVQEPTEDGSSMDFGLIKGDELRFLHQAFITDTLAAALELKDTDVRLYYIDDPDRVKLVGIVTDYLDRKLAGRAANSFKNNFALFDLERERWGIRIENVFQQCFATGYDQIIVVGSRTPTVTTSQLRTTQKMLCESDAVFGPTPDGRYYLIGMSGSYKIELSQFDWKSPTIYSEVVSAFADQSLKWSELEIWYAVERSDDLELLARDINQYRFEGDTITAHETELVLERILTRLDG